MECGVVSPRSITRRRCAISGYTRPPFPLDWIDPKFGWPKASRLIGGGCFNSLVQKAKAYGKEPRSRGWRRRDRRPGRPDERGDSKVSAGLRSREAGRRELLATTIIRITAAVNAVRGSAILKRRAYLVVIKRLPIPLATAGGSSGDIRAAIDACTPMPCHPRSRSGSAGCSGPAWHWIDLISPGGELRRRNGRLSRCAAKRMRGKGGKEAIPL